MTMTIMMTKMKTSFILILALLTLSFSTMGQTPFRCGSKTGRSVITPEYIKIALRIAKNDTFYQPVNRILSISAHVVTDCDSNLNYDTANLRISINQLNTDFKPSGIQFKLCKLDTIYNCNYDSWFSSNDSRDPIIRNTYHDDRMINFYIVQSLGSAAGYADASTNEVFLTKNGTLAGTHTISHEMGHFFGLPHTWEGAGVGQDLKISGELVDRSDCATTGDRICDTQADIDGSHTLTSSAFGNCVYYGDNNFMDNNGEHLLPPVNNIMSYWNNDNCSCLFTLQQYQVILAYFHTKSKRGELW